MHIRWSRRSGSTTARSATTFFGLLLMLLTPVESRGDVTEATPSGFSIKIDADINAGSVAVYRALADQVRLWWDANHTWSGNASNLSIDPRPGGCFCEQLPGGGVQHMTVTYVDRPRQLRLQGGLGPLGSLAVAGTMTWVITETSGRSRLELTYNVGGYLSGGLISLASPVDGVLTTQVKRLKTFVETGRPE